MDAAGGHAADTLPTPTFAPAPIPAPAPMAAPASGPGHAGAPGASGGPRRRLLLALTAGAALLLGWVTRWTGAEAAQPLAAALFWGSLLLGLGLGVPPTLGALREGRVSIDVLMVVAAGLGAWVGHPEEGALLMFLFTLSGALERLAMERTKREVRALHRLMPTRAIVRHDARWEEVPVESLRPGDRILIRAGDTVPADARVAVGRSALDTATLTGESVPRRVGPGDEAPAGAVNAGDPVEADVLRPAAESSLQRILDLVTTAQTQREPIQRIIDRLNQPYAVGVIALSAGVFLAWWLALGRPVAGPDGALMTAITLLIVASPCALVISTPTATLAAISRGARAGVLFKGGQSLERLARTGSLCLDKTGTLTLGRPTLAAMRLVAGGEGPGAEARLLGVAAGLEAGSTHPIAAAVREAVRARGIAPARVEHPTQTPGVGVAGVVAGAPAAIGESEVLDAAPAAAGAALPASARSRVESALDRARAAGMLTAVLVVHGDGGPAVAVLEFTDALRRGAREMVGELHRLGVRPIRMLTGDHRAAAERIAREVGVDEWHADLSPEQKIRLLERAKAGRTGPRRGVGVIGDGVNDAPALAAADAAIAIGSVGSGAALESADIVLLNEDLRAVPWAVRLARRARLTVAANLALAMGIILFMAALTLAGSLTGRPVGLPLAVVAHEGGTLLVVANSLRLLLVRGFDARAGAAPAPTAAA